MNLMTLFPVAFTFFITLIVSWVVLAPLFFHTEPARVSENEEALGELITDKEELLSSLEELEQDKLSGRLSTEDYEGNKKDLLGHTVQVLGEIERLQAKQK